jgi:hypothetical protein
MKYLNVALSIFIVLLLSVTAIFETYLLYGTNLLDDRLRIGSYSGLGEGAAYLITFVFCLALIVLFLVVKKWLGRLIGVVILCFIYASLTVVIVQEDESLYSLVYPFSFISTKPIKLDYIDCGDAGRGGLFCKGELSSCEITPIFLKVRNKYNGGIFFRGIPPRDIPRSICFKTG